MEQVFKLGLKHMILLDECWLLWGTLTPGFCLPKRYIALQVLHQVFINHSYIIAVFTYKRFSLLISWHHYSKFSKMARYDMTGIGINLREVPDDVGAVKLKVLGLILDGPAHRAGVRQVLHVQLAFEVIYSTSPLISFFLTLSCFLHYMFSIG